MQHNITIITTMGAYNWFLSNFQGFPGPAGSRGESGGKGLPVSGTANHPIELSCIVTII